MIVQKEYCLSHTQYITECYYNIVHIYYNKHFVNDIMSINCSRQFHECSEHKLNGNSLFINNLQEMVQHNMFIINNLQEMVQHNM